jgi:hypothetical protein
MERRDTLSHVDERHDMHHHHNNNNDIMTTTIQQSYHDMVQSLAQVTSTFASSSSTAMFTQNLLSLVSALEHTSSVMNHLAHTLKRSHNMNTTSPSSSSPSSSLVQLLPPLHHSGGDSFLTNADSYSTFDDSFMVPESSSPLSPHPNHESDNPINVDEYDDMMMVVVPVKKEEEEKESLFPFKDEPSSIVGSEVGLASSSSEIGDVSRSSSTVPKTSSNPSTPKSKKRPRIKLVSPASKSSSTKTTSSKQSSLVRKSRRERPISKRMKDSLTQVQTRPISKPTVVKPSMFGVASNIKATKSTTPGRSHMSSPRPLNPILSPFIIGPTGRLMTLDYWQFHVPSSELRDIRDEQ